MSRPRQIAGSSFNARSRGYARNVITQLAGSSFDAAFAAGRMFGASSFSSAFSCTRVTNNGGTATARKVNNTLTRHADNQLRLNDRGLLVEEQRVNLVRNPSFAGASAPSTLPSNMNIFKDAGLTVTVVETGILDGVNYFRFRVNGTTISSGNLLCLFETNSFIVSTAGVHCVGLSTRLEAGSMSGITNPRIILQEYTSGSGFIGSSVAGALSFGPVWNRSNDTLTAVGTGGNNLRVFMQLDHGAGVAVDFTIDVGIPQVEKGAFPLSSIAGAGSQCTRTSDTVQLNNPETFIGLASGSIYCEWEEVLGAIGVQRYLWSYRVDGNNYIRVYIGGDNKVYFDVANGGVLQCNLASTNTIVAGQKYKMAVAWENGRFALRLSAALGSPANIASGTPPTGTPVLWVGSNQNSVLINQPLRRITGFLTAQNDNRLNALVA